MAGIYLHIPFCKQQCNYCNFHFSTSLALKEQVLKGVQEEIAMQKNYLDGHKIETIYLGGGTPSLLSADEINRIVQTLDHYFPLQHIREFTLEANPDDLTSHYLKELRHTDITRFSIGVQSFKEADLRYMNRAHNARQAEYAIKGAQDAGFSELTIDLIYGTPGLTDAEWQHHLSQVKSLQIPHFSAYALTVEEGTILHHAIQRKKVIPVDQEQSARQLEMLMSYAVEMGYEHYEISNLALPGHYAIHNTNYWKGIPYLGIGPSAHSFNGSTRRWNIANNALYCKSILTDKKLCYQEELLTSIQRLNEYIMTSLRTMWGCDLQTIANQWGDDYVLFIKKAAEIFQEKNWLTTENERLILTNTGKLYADRIAGDLFIGENDL